MLNIRVSRFEIIVMAGNTDSVVEMIFIQNAYGVALLAGGVWPEIRPTTF